MTDTNQDMRQPEPGDFPPTCTTTTEGSAPAPQQKPDCKAIAGVDPCSALAEALDDGQEVEMHHFWNPSKQRNDYRVRICGDCFIEAEHENLNDAINSAAEKYQLWEEDAE